MAWLVRLRDDAAERCSDAVGSTALNPKRRNLGAQNLFQEGQEREGAGLRSGGPWRFTNARLNARHPLTAETGRTIK
jgi:hypothetical protein